MDFLIKEKKIALLLIDPQNDFHEGGSLAVPGALDDSKRIADMIKLKGGLIDQIYVTLDSHHRMHISHGAFWTDSNGKEPPPFTTISNHDIMEGQWMPRNNRLLGHCLLYTAHLEESGRFEHCIWPEHCLIGTRGHAVVSVLNDALQEWCVKYGKTVQYISKGQNCLTEMYSALKAEVPIENDPTTALNKTLIDELRAYDKIFIGGEAKSHCVNFTARDLVADWPASKVQHVVILSDGCSSVPNFEQAGEDFFHDMMAKGCAIGSTEHFEDFLDNADQIACCNIL